MANEHCCVCVLRAAVFDNGKKRTGTRNEVRTAKGYDAPLEQIYPGNRHTDATTEKTKNAIQFGKRKTADIRVHAHTRAHTRSNTKNNNNTRKSYVPVYMQYPFSNKFRSSNTPRTLTDYLL